MCLIKYNYIISYKGCYLREYIVWVSLYCLFVYIGGSYGFMRLYFIKIKIDNNRNVVIYKFIILYLLLIVVGNL